MTTHKITYPVRVGSAWHGWQNAGVEWYVANKGSGPEQVAIAAKDFAENSGAGWGNKDLSRDAMQRAFTEGVMATSYGLNQSKE